MKKKQTETMEEAPKSAATHEQQTFQDPDDDLLTAEHCRMIEEEFRTEIQLRFNALKYEFQKIVSPNKEKLIENKVKELDDLLHGDSDPGKLTLMEKMRYKPFTQEYVKTHVLTGGIRAVEFCEVGGSTNSHHRRWIIDAHANYQFYLWLKENGKDETKAPFDYTPHLAGQMKALKFCCKEFIETGSRSIFRRQAIIDTVKSAKDMAVSFPSLYVIRFYSMIKEAFEDTFVQQALNVKGICPGLKNTIEKALSELEPLQKRISRKPATPRKVYTIDDWLNETFILDKEFDPPLSGPEGTENWGRLLLNDSEVYFSLVCKFDAELERMTSDTVWKILEYQAQAYKQIVKNEYDYRVSAFEKKVNEIRQRFGSETAVSTFVKSELKYIQKFEQALPAHFEAIITLRKFRNMPYGAKFITAHQYKKRDDILPSIERLNSNKIINAPTVTTVRDGVLIRIQTPEIGGDIRPQHCCEGEMEYAFMEALTEFKYYLEDFENRQAPAKALFEKIQRGEPINHPHAVSVVSAAPAQPEKKPAEKKIQQPAVALIHFYNEEDITQSNADQIAKEYGFTSGEALLQEYYRIQTRKNRIGKPGSKLNKTRIGQLEKQVFPNLTKKGAKERCKADLQEAKAQREEIQDDENF
jgi:hypothetical protein